MNTDYERREQLIFGRKYDKANYMGGCRRFSCDREKLKQLIDEGFLDPSSYQNNSPYAKDFLDTTEGFEYVHFQCYAISPDRDDYRVTVEGVTAVISDTNYDHITLAVESFRCADEFTFDHNGDTYTLYAWWD